MGKRYLVAFTVALLLAAVALPAAADGTSVDAVEQRIAEETVAFINAERVAAGVDPLAVWDTDEHVVRSNEDYSETWEGHRIFSEVAGDYPSATARLVGENQGPRGRSGGQVAGWRRSPGHNANQLRPELTHMAVAVSCGATGTGAMTAHFIVSSEPRSPTPVAEELATGDAGTSCADALPVTGHTMDDVAAYLPWVGGGFGVLLVLSLMSTLADRRKRAALQQNAQKPERKAVEAVRAGFLSGKRPAEEVVDDIIP